MSNLVGRHVAIRISREISAWASMGLGVLLALIGQPSLAGPIADAEPPFRSFRLPFAAAPSFNLLTTEGLAELYGELTQLLQWTDSRAERRQQTRDSQLRTRALSSMSSAELRDWFNEPQGWLGKKERRAAQSLHELAGIALATPDPQSREVYLREIHEIAAAVENLQRRPVPAYVDFVIAPLFIWKYFYAPLGKGIRPAANIRSVVGGADLAAIDPENSTFWTKPLELERQDLALGFGRTVAPEFEAPVWIYRSPKTGYGTSPGFDVQHSSQRLKVKFAETRSEPFAARVFDALGYNVEPTDHVPGLKIRYDRRLFLEFNLRRDVSTRVTTFLVPSYTIRIQEWHNPFDFIVAAVLKDGRTLASGELKQRLLRSNSDGKQPLTPDVFNAAFEGQIDYLVTAPANVHSSSDRGRSVGIWDFDTLGHADLRELRGMAILAAWLGWFDTRMLNTRLVVLETEQGLRLRHDITDLGSSLGNASSLISRHCEQPEEFSWSFTRAPKVQGRGRMTIPFRITDYRPIETPGAFKQMTLDDARWMARWIGKLTHSQLREALIASGFSPEHVSLYLEKLVSRRDRMIQDLGLADEIPLLESTHWHSLRTSAQTAATP